jgi:hypothetical protein
MRTIRRSEASDPGRVPEVGWTFEVPERHPGGPSTAEIVEVLDVPGYTLFRVRWDDGSESTFIPSRGHRAHPPAATASL